MKQLKPVRKIQIIATILTIIAQPYFVWSAFQTRGHFAIGGEWLVPVLVLAAFELVQEACDFIKEIAEEIELEDE